MDEVSKIITCFSDQKSNHLCQECITKVAATMLCDLSHVDKLRESVIIDSVSHLPISQISPRTV